MLSQIGSVLLLKSVLYELKTYLLSCDTFGSLRRGDKESMLELERKEVRSRKTLASGRDCIGANGEL